MIAELTKLVKTFLADVNTEVLEKQSIDRSRSREELAGQSKRAEVLFPVPG